MKYGHLWLAAAAAVAVWRWAMPLEASAQAPPPGPDLTSQASAALVEGRAEEALARADAAIKADPHAPWAHYCRAEALATLKRYDEAIGAYEVTRSRLPEPDLRGQALAVWGQAFALRETGRCEEAKRALADFVAMMGPIDADAATQAQRYADACPSAGDLFALKPSAVAARAPARSSRVRARGADQPLPEASLSPTPGEGPLPSPANGQ